MLWVRRVVLGLLAFSLLAVPACSKRRNDPGPTAPGHPVALRLQTVSTAFTFPTFLTAPPADTSRLFVLEKAGTIRIIKSNVLLATPFLDLTGVVNDALDEQGLLGLAFEPNYAVTGRFIVSYTDANDDLKIVRYQRSGNPDVANASPVEELLTIPHPDVNHYGGMLAFGPDGYLWISSGDGGGANDQYGNGQSRDDLLGSMLRIDVSGASGYTSPAGNPYSGVGDRRELWNIGLRNPWRFSFDRQTGDLYIADVGQDSREEINIALASSNRSPGANYGWPIMEGRACFQSATCNTSGLTQPAVEYLSTDGSGNCAVTGGYVNRGASIPSLVGWYLYADYCGHVVRMFKPSGGSAIDDKELPELDTTDFISSFGEDARGEVYVLTDTGKIYRIAAQ